MSTLRAADPRDKHGKFGCNLGMSTFRLFVSFFYLEKSFVKGAGMHLESKRSALKHAEGSTGKRPEEKNYLLTWLGPSGSAPWRALERDRWGVEDGDFGEACSPFVSPHNITPWIRLFSATGARYCCGSRHFLFFLGGVRQSRHISYHLVKVKMRTEYSVETISCRSEEIKIEVGLMASVMSVLFPVEAKGNYGGFVLCKDEVD